MELITGDYASAEKHTHESADIYRQLNDAEGESFALHQLGVVHMRAGNMDAAEHALQRSLELAYSCGVEAVIAESHFHTGWFNLGRKSYPEAKEHHKKALILLRKLGLQSAPWKREVDGAHLVHALNDLGLASNAQGQSDESLAYFREALALALKFGTRAHARASVLESVVGIATVLLSVDNAVKAAELVAFSLAQPEIDADARAQAETLAAQLQAQLPAEEVKKAETAGRSLRFEGLERALANITA